MTVLSCMQFAKYDNLWNPMLHKVVWQHMQGLLGSLITIFLQIYSRESPREKIEKRSRFDSYSREFGVQCFGPPCIFWPTTFFFFENFSIDELNDL